MAQAQSLNGVAGMPVEPSPRLDPSDLRRRVHSFSDANSDRGSGAVGRVGAVQLVVESNFRPYAMTAVAACIAIAAAADDTETERGFFVHTHLGQPLMTIQLHIGVVAIDGTGLPKTGSSVQTV